MLYSVSDLEKEVRICLDRNMTSEALSDLEDVDTLALDDIIRSKIEHAAYIVERNAPNYMIDGGKSFAGTIGWGKELKVGSSSYARGTLALPDDFMRMVTFKMSDWDMAVTDFVDETDERYFQLQSRYVGLAGTPQCPVAALVQTVIDDKQCLALEFYTCGISDNTKATVERAYYLPRPKIDNGEIDLCTRLKDAVVYYTAYLTALAVGQENAEALRGTSNTLAEMK